MSSQLRTAAKVASRNRLAMIGFAILVGFVFVGIFAPFLAPYDPFELDPTRGFHPPSSEHWFGTDRLGRDILSRVIFGVRLSFAVVASTTVVSGLLGTAIGLIAGYVRKLDEMLMRICDGLMAFPSIVLALAIMAALGPSLINVIVALCATRVPRLARVVRGAVLSIRDSEFVQAAEAAGASSLRIAFKHILPNCIAPIIVQLTIYAAVAVIQEASLSFLGAGVPPAQPSWGTILSTGRDYMRTAWWIAVYPGIAIMITTLGINLFGDGLRDALDPTMYTER